jgi:predicted SAM-dependent methyltransferase
MPTHTFDKTQTEEEANVKLNLGCGHNKRDGYVNIDKYPVVSPDMLWDLEQTPYPFETNSVAEIAATHVLEHLGQSTDVFLGIIKELHRILKPGGTIDITVPCYRSDAYWGDPTHVRPVTPAMLYLFSKKNCRMFAERRWPHTPLADYLDVDLELETVSMSLSPHWRDSFQRGEITQADVDLAFSTQWNVVDEIKMVVRKV